MGHHFRGSTCTYCGCSVHSFAAEDECMGQRGLYAREDEAYEDWKDNENIKEAS